LADRVSAQGEGEDIEHQLRPQAQHALDPSFATQLLHRLRDGSRSAGQALIWLENELERQGSSAEAIISAEHQTLSSGNVTTANIVRGLKLINDVQWTVWFEQISKVDALLGQEERFSELDFASRDQYRSEIEELARGSDLTEFAVAEKAIELSKKAADETPDTSNIGFFLVGDRLGEIEKAIGYRVPISLRLLRFFRKTSGAGTVVPMLVLAALLLVPAGFALDNIGISDGWIALILVLTALPACEAGLGVFNKLVLLTLEPTRLVGFEFKDGVPTYARTLVVVPSL